MKYLFIAGLYPTEQERFFIDKAKSGSLQNAPNVFQWNVVDGLSKNEVDFSVLSAPFVASYPLRFRCAVIPSFPVFYQDKRIGKTERYLNVLGLKEQSLRNSIRKGILSWIAENSIQKDDRFSIITYTPLSFFLEAVGSVKKHYPNLIVCSIVTDLIEDAKNFDVNRSFFKKIQVRKENKLQHKLFGSIDKFVLLSSAMEERIPEAIGKSIVVEGIAKVPEMLPVTKKNADIKTLLYTGSLHEFAGIKSLVEAFVRTRNENFRLMICGKGACEEFIKEKAKEDKRIMFLGNIHRDEAVKEQYKATALVNPRPPTETITRYSFPSKTMEYLSSGTPMIGYQLEGIPQEYYDYFYSPADLKINSMTKTIEFVLNQDAEALNAFGKKAYDFIKKKKNSKVQVGRIIKFIEQ